jgi:hypothetical protein
MKTVRYFFHVRCVRAHVSRMYFLLTAKNVDQDLNPTEKEETI